MTAVIIVAINCVIIALLLVNNRKKEKKQCGRKIIVKFIAVEEIIFCHLTRNIMKKKILIQIYEKTRASKVERVEV